MTELSRRDILKAGAAGIAGSTLGGLFGSIPNLAAAAESATPKMGGKAVAAMSAATETIDPHFSRSQAARNVLMHMYETLVTVDEHSAPQLQLAEKLVVSPDSRVYTFTLRKGVTFHNGKEMTAVDAQKSLERYARVSPEKVRLANVDRMLTPDKYTLVVELKSSTPAWIELIKSPASPMTVIPAEERDKEPNKISPIATGPFQFVDWNGVTELNMKRYKDYNPNMAYPGRDGYGGRRTVYLDEVSFRVVTEGSARVAGLQTGQFQIVDDVPILAARRLQRDPQFRVYDRMPIMMNVVAVNVSKPPTDNILVCRAIQQVINAEEIMAVATEGEFRLNPSFIYPDSQFYPKQAGELIYNAKNAEKAKALLKEAGYKGEELIILTSADIASLKEVAVVLAEELKSIGMKVRLDVLDWPGATARRNDPTSHNLFSGAYAIQPMVGPFQYQRLFSGPGNWSFYKEDKVMDDAWERLLSATSIEDRRKAWWDIERRINEQVYQLKIGDRGVKQVATARLQNFKTFDAIRMWDVWLA